MSFLDLLFLPPLMLAIAMVVGAAGRRPGDLAVHIRRTFWALTLGVVAVGIVVRLVVVLFA